MKKIIKYIMAACGILVLMPILCACEDEAIQEVPTLTWMIPGDKQPDSERVLSEVNTILEKNVGAKIDIQFVDATVYDERMKADMTNENDFDLCFTGYLNSYEDAVARGAFYDITDLVENSEKLKSEIPDYFWEMLKMNGKLYAVPNAQIVTECTGLYIREDLAEEYGLDLSKIKALDDIEPFLAYVKENHPEVYPFRTGRYNGGVKDTVNNFDKIYNIRVYSDDNGNIDCKTPDEDPMFWKEVELLRDWYEKGYIRSDVARVTDDTTEHNAGKYAVWRGVYKPGGVEEYNSSNKVQAVCVQLNEPYMYGNSAPAANTAIGIKSKYPELAFEVLEEINTNKELFNLLVYGIEGEHYTLENNRVKYIENSGYAPKNSWKFGNVFNSLLLPGQADDVWEETRKFHDLAQKSSLLGFHLDTAPIQMELSELNIINSKYKTIQNGSLPIESYKEEYLKELKEAGIEKIKEEIIKQAEEWKESEK